MQEFEIKESVEFFCKIFHSAYFVDLEVLIKVIGDDLNKARE